MRGREKQKAPLTLALSPQGRGNKEKKGEGKEKRGERQKERG